MKAEDAKVGQRVRVSTMIWGTMGPHFDPKPYEQGTIKRKADTGKSAAIEFDLPIPDYTNDCHGSTKPGHGKYIYWTDLKPSFAPNESPSWANGLKIGEIVTISGTKFTIDEFSKTVDTLRITTSTGISTWISIEELRSKMDKRADYSEGGQVYTTGIDSYAIDGSKGKSEAISADKIRATMESLDRNRPPLIDIRGTQDEEWHKHVLNMYQKKPPQPIIVEANKYTIEQFIKLSDKPKRNLLLAVAAKYIK